MVKKTLQNKIATSRFALPVTVLYTVLVWFPAIRRDENIWLPLALLGIATYLMAELDNRNALMRTYSRMISCSFLILNTANIYIFRNYTTSIIQLSTAICYLAFFASYQDKRAMGKVFVAFVAIGSASVLFIQILFFVPILWIILASRIMAMNIRTFLASLVGIVTPYWLLEGYNIAIGKPLQMIHHFIEIAKFDAPFVLPSGDNTYPIVVFSFMLLLVLIGGIHYLRTSYKDKIRIRSLYEILLIMSICSLFFIAIQPRHWAYIIPMLTVSVSPLIAHYITFTQTRLTNLSFFILMVLTVALTVFNLRMIW